MTVTPLRGDPTTAAAPTSRSRGTLALLGPAFVAAIAYVDPGNVATNVTAGAEYGYLLVWVVVVTSAIGALEHTFRPNSAWPREARPGRVLLAAGMLGATVMPHAAHLHSALARDRHGRAGRDRLPRLLSATRMDIGIAMLVAGAVNLAMLLVAATSIPAGPGSLSLQDAHDAIGQSLGGIVAALLAVGLLASGVTSTTVGCYAGSVVMAGLLRRSVPVLTRRLITVAPAVLILAVGADPTLTLLLSQVVLALGLPFALVPLVLLTRSRAVMGTAANHPATTATATGVVALVIGLNLTLIWLMFTGRS
jgi:manganese transport protein